MNASELLRALHESGTGLDKVEAAKARAKAEGRRLRDMSGGDILALTGSAWPEGTIRKALRILAGQPADMQDAPRVITYEVEDDAQADEPPAEDPPKRRRGRPASRVAAQPPSHPGISRADVEEE